MTSGFSSKTNQRPVALLVGNYCIRSSVDSGRCSHFATLPTLTSNRATIARSDCRRNNSLSENQAACANVNQLQKSDGCTEQSSASVRPVLRPSCRAPRAGTDPKLSGCRSNGIYTMSDTAGRQWEAGSCQNEARRVCADAKAGDPVHVALKSLRYNESKLGMNAPIRTPGGAYRTTAGAPMGQGM